MKWSEENVKDLKRLEKMSKHDMYDAILKDWGMFDMVCYGSLDMLHMPLERETFNADLDAVMGEILIQEADAYDTWNMSIAEFLSTVENMTHDEFRYIDTLTRYFIRLNCYPRLYTYTYKRQEINRAYNCMTDLLVKYREIHFKPLMDMSKQSNEEDQTINGEKPSLESGHVLAKSSTNGSKKWFTQDQVLIGEADDFEAFKYMLDGKIKGWDNLKSAKSRISAYHKKLNLGERKRVASDPF